MKTTLELPDDLYREVKATAAMKHKKMKDLVARGLELVLAEEKQSTTDAPLTLLNRIRANPPYTHQQVKEWQEEAYQVRKEGWDGDA